MAARIGAPAIGARLARAVTFECRERAALVRGDPDVHHRVPRAGMMELGPQLP
ncbi:hypothetical protein [Nocardia fluminea]|uniref:hypothetical protein n=1 Tax=Nocardia fluminea TaxID=134984 RepID=UPI001FE29436|nr:hypothetical protein [Nocardia fluminea]